MIDRKMLPVLGKDFIQLLINAGLVSSFTTRVYIEADMDGVLTIEETRHGGREWLERLRVHLAGNKLDAPGPFMNQTSAGPVDSSGAKSD